MQVSLFYLFLGFFLGALPFGYWLALRLGVDLRKEGSGNTGATNVGRVLGKKWGYVVFALDLGKGWAAVALAFVGGNLSEFWATAAGISAVLGHVFSPWLGFRGGKGVATSAGVLFGLAPIVASAVVLIWLVIFKICGTVSIASLTAATAFPFLVLWLLPGHPFLQWTSVGLTLLVWVRHGENLKRLFRGKENRFAEKKNSTS